MENKKKRNKAIIISLLVLIVLILVLFLAYKNKDSFGVKTSSVLTKIFNSLETSENQKRELVIAEENINAGDSVVETGKDGDIRKVKKGSDNSIGRAVSNIEAGMSGEIEISEADFNSFWDSFSQFLDNGFKFNQFCSDGKDNDGDGLVDVEDPHCHIGGDLNKEYLPNHYSESISPFDPNSICSDGKDNDGDGLVDVEDPHCHIGGDLNKEYLPNHYSESISPFDPDFGIEGVDLTAGIIYPISSPVNTEIELSSVIENRGNENSGQDVNVLFTISDTKEADSINSLYLLTTIPQINSRDTAIAKVKNTFTSIGNYYIRACADKKDLSDEGSINEAFEDNNCGGWTTFSVTNVLPDTGGRPECSDEKDNDGDGLVDIKDPHCHKDGDLNAEYLPEYDSESKNSTECSDTLDNDDDGLIDEKDPVCHVEGDLNKEYTPSYNSESILSYVCNDTLDNDKDGYIDALDPNCHEGGSLSKLYKATHDSESESPEEPNICLSLIPITFTDEQEKRLDELLRKFYLLAPNLKSELDVSLVYKEVANQQNFISQVETLTKECYARVDNDPTYEGPKTRYGNPWYHYGDRGSYISENTSSGKTSYCKNDPSKTKPLFFDSKLCATFKNRGDCEGLTKTPNFFLSFGFYYEKTSCTWVETINLQEYETLLNIW